MKRPERILHVVRGLTNSSGTTHIVGPLAEEQARLGCEVEVMFVEKDGQQPVLPASELVRSTCLPLSLPLSNPGISWAFAQRLRRVIKSFDRVHVHAVWNFPTFWTMWMAVLARVPFMVAPQGSFEPWALQQNRFSKRLYGALTERRVYDHASRFQALTENEAAQIAAFGIKAPSAIIPNGVDAEDFAGQRVPLTEHLDLDPATRTLLFLSRLHPKKGVDVLLRGFARSGLAAKNVRLGHRGER